MRKATLFNTKLTVLRWISLLTFVMGVSLQAQAQTPCPPVTVFCQDLHTSFMADACMVEVWAKDFISKINDHETSLDDYIISFEEDSEVMSRIYESLDGDTFEVTIWITSRCDASLKTRCIVTLDINDNTGLCPTTRCPVDPNPWCGMAIITCSTVQNSPDETTGHVAAILDTRKNSKAPRGDNWTNPIDATANNLPLARPEAWRINRLGNIYGISLNPTNGDIFFAASDVYDFDFQQFVSIGPPPPAVTGPAGSGGIYRSNILNPEVTSVFVSTSSTYLQASDVIGANLIPNTGNLVNDVSRSGNGIGNIDYDVQSDHLLISNLEDGKLYSIDANTGIVTDVHDPFGPYVHTPGLVTESERVWGVQVNDCGLISRLFFARNARVPSTAPDVIQPKEIWSIALDRNGNFVGTERIEVIVGKGDMSKLTDLAFSSDCRKLIVSERGNPHSAELNQYVLNSSNDWVYDRQFYLGLFDLNNQGPNYPSGIAGNSSGGGAAYGPQELNCVLDASCDDLVWGTMNCGDIVADDANPPNPTNCAIYGAQGINSNGNTLPTAKSTDIFISVDSSDNLDAAVRLKSNLGDIEIFNCCCPTEPGRNQFNAGLSAMIGGEIFTETNARVSNTNIAVSSLSIEQDKMTNNQGEYLFEEMSMHENYRIQPKKTGAFLDGVSTLDLVLIQRHILGISKLDSPYKIIAGDVDMNNKITASDLVKLRRHILGVSIGSEDLSWTFVPASFEFENEAQPFPFEKSIQISDLEENTMHEDFIAVKIGDVNGDNSFNKYSNSRELKTSTLLIEEHEGVVNVRMAKAIDLSGLQFEIQLGNIRSINNIAGVNIDISEANYSLSDKSLKLSWNSNSYKSIMKGDVLISFEIESTDETANYELDNTKMQAQAYDNNALIYDLELRNTRRLSDEHTLIGASPNPFSGETTIVFELKESMEVEVVFYGVDGRLIHRIKDNYSAGRNTVDISTSDFDRLSGNIVVYKVIAGGRTETSKLIVVE